MKLALLGATGLSGVAVLRTALERGHEIVALARDPAAVATRHDRLRVVRGDALIAADLEACLPGCQAVVHCLGVGGKGSGKPTTICSETVALLLPAMRAAQIRRLVVMSNLGAGNSGPWLMRKIAMPLFLRWLQPIVDDKDRMEAVLRDAPDLDWIAPRFPQIVDGPARPYRVCPPDGRGAHFKITTGSVAAFMLDHLDGDALVRTTPAVSN